MNRFSVAFFSYSPFLVLVFCLFVFFSCFSSEGILETEDAVNARNAEIQSYNNALIVYAANSCWIPQKKTEGECFFAFLELSSLHDSCRGAFLPYPWDRKDKCIKK